jgi:[acyl-carrier-protein] S-malonyltransferase
VCAESAQDEVVAAVNFNSPGQVVIAGHAAAVERAMAAARAAGAKRALALPVSVPSHCSLMQPAADNMQQRLATIAISTPAIAVINNVDVTAEMTIDAIRNALVRQMYQPVRWVETIQFMQAGGIRTIVECGPGKVLTGLNKRIDRDMTALPLFDPASLQKTLETIATVEET